MVPTICTYSVLGVRASGHDLGMMVRSRGLLCTRGCRCTREMPEFLECVLWGQPEQARYDGCVCGAPPAGAAAGPRRWEACPCSSFWAVWKNWQDGRSVGLVCVLPEPASRVVEKSEAPQAPGWRPDPKCFGRLPAGFWGKDWMLPKTLVPGS